jgi:hypothetical protein
VVHALAQRLADLGAVAAGEPRRVVPRLEHDTSLPHQIAVMAADLLASGTADDLSTAADAVEQTSREIG